MTPIRMCSAIGLSLTGAFALGCAGPAAPLAAAPPPAASAAVVVRIDYSHVDGGSCMSTGGRPSLAWKQTWDLSSCKPRSEGAKNLSDPCRAAYNAECCSQIDATVIGWEAHVVGGEKLVSPLCRL